MSETVRTVRRRLGWTQEQFGRALGLSVVSVNRLENSERCTRGATLDHFTALHLVSVKSPQKREGLKAALDNPRWRFLLELYMVAYGNAQRD